MIRELIRQLIETMTPKAKNYAEFTMEDSLLEVFMSGKILIGHDPEEGEIRFVHWDKEEKNEKTIGSLLKWSSHDMNPDVCKGCGESHHYTVCVYDLLMSIDETGKLNKQWENDKRKQQTKMKKLFTDDRDIHYKTTTIQPTSTKADIDGILAKWGIKKVAWELDFENNIVSVSFELPPEKFGDTQLNPVITLEPPRIWNKRKRNSEECINWRVSMRTLHWFIKTTLEMNYAIIKGCGFSALHPN